MKNWFYFFFWIQVKSTTKSWRNQSVHSFLKDSLWPSVSLRCLGYIHWVSISLRCQDALEHVVWTCPHLRAQKPLVFPKLLHEAEKLANCSFDCNCLSVWQRSQSVVSLSEVSHPFISLQEKNENRGYLIRVWSLHTKKSNLTEAISTLITSWHKLHSCKKKKTSKKKKKRTSVAIPFMPRW